MTSVGPSSFHQQETNIEKMQHGHAPITFTFTFTVTVTPFNFSFHYDQSDHIFSDLPQYQLNFMSALFTTIHTSVVLRSHTWPNLDRPIENLASKGTMTISTDLLDSIRSSLFSLQWAFLALMFQVSLDGGR